ncbi:MAG: hypothetical protein II664_02705, partial [Oscillospiraceae bacterium]|nr:hypothetical protein [Oscillospiraceae bacterium]
MRLFTMITAVSVLCSGGALALPSVYESTEVIPCSAFSDDDTDGDIVGADWRTWGIIDDYGTINTGSEEIDVCVCLFADRAELYYNEESQSLYRTIEYLRRLTTKQYENSNISFEDFNDDGMTDIRVTVEDSEGVELWMTWVYDTDDFVYMVGLEYPPVPVITKPEVTALKLSDGKISLKWEEVPGAEKYAVYRKSGGKVKKIRETTKLSAVIKADKNDKGYAVKAYIDGEWTKLTSKDIVTPALYSDKKLISMAKKYYKAANGYLPPIAEIDHREGHYVTIHLYEEVDDGDGSSHTATYAWYTVDDRTGKGTDDISLEKIDLTKTPEKK